MSFLRRPRLARGPPLVSVSKSAFGRIRSSHPGSHQFQEPISSIVAGTSTSRTSVASSAIATLRPTPISLTCGTPVVAKMAKTTTMMIAALVITFALACRPSATARRLSPVAR